MEKILHVSFRFNEHKTFMNAREKDVQSLLDSGWKVKKIVPFSECVSTSAGTDSCTEWLHGDYGVIYVLEKG